MSYHDSHGFVSRGDPSTYDRTETTLTEDAAWHNLDLSAVVPTGAKSILFKAYAKSGSAGAYMYLRPTGSTNSYAAGVVYTQVANIYSFEIMGVPCDSSQDVQYYVTTNMTAEGLVVMGWWF